MEKFNVGETAYFCPKPETWIKVAVIGERFNNGNGGFYDIRYMQNGRTRTVSGEYLSKISGSR